MSIMPLPRLNYLRVLFSSSLCAESAFFRTSCRVKLVFYATLVEGEFSARVSRLRPECGNTFQLVAYTIFHYKERKVNFNALPVVQKNRTFRTA